MNLELEAKVKLKVDETKKINNSVLCIFLS
jgi:hypothetical protein